MDMDGPLTVPQMTILVTFVTVVVLLICVWTFVAMKRWSQKDAEKRERQIKKALGETEDEAKPN